MKPDLLDLHTGFLVSWEIDIWGKLNNKKKASYARFLASIEGKNVLITNLISQIAFIYYELISLDNSLQIIETSNDLLKNALDIIKAQKEAGFATELAVQQFEASLLNAESMEIQIKQSIIENENNLNNLLGRYPQPISRNKISSLINKQQNFKAGTPLQLLSHRPDIKQNELELLATKADVKAARAAFYPSLGIMGGGGFHSFNPAFFLHPEALVYNILAGISAPLLNRNNLKAEFKIANAAQQSAFLNYQQSIITAYLEVNTALNNIKNLNAMEELKRKETEVLSKAVESSSELYKSGRAGYIEVLIAQKNALTGKMELNEIQKKLKQAEVNLYKALGGGWKN
ncbi:MAG: TolC family protein [Bacteroidia bacterium]|nr:TolC family protein [Bacteroidia bacterium]